MKTSEKLEQRKERSAKPQAARKNLVLGAAFLIVATFIVYFPVFRAGFIWDDPDYVLNNATLRTFDGLRQIWLVPLSLPQWYPLVHTTFWIEYHLVGTQPLLYHIDNVLLHALSSILIWRLLRRLEVPGAYFAACLFAAHPVMVESVAWVTERKNVLSLVFYLLAMRVYLFQFNPTRSNRAYALALIFFLCALFSKTVTASLPAAILLIFWWKNGRIKLRDIWPLIPFFIVGIIMGAVTGYLETHHVGANGEIVPELRLSLVQRCLIAGRAIWFYLAKLLYPHPLTFIYPRWNEIDHPTAWQWIFPALVIIATLVLFSLRRRIGRGVVVAWLIFCGTLFPALGFVNVYPMRFSFVADHFQYHASVAIFALIAAISSHLAPRMRGAIWGIILVILGCLTWQQTKVYKDAETLWRDTMVKNPNSWMVYTNLGNALAQQNRYDEAIPYHEEALKLAPYLHDTHWNAGVGLMRQGKVDEAEKEFRTALQITPDFAPALESLGELYFYNRHDSKQAIEYYQQALKIAPGYAEANYYYAVAIEHEANDARQKFLQTKNEADGIAALNKLNEAIDHYRTAVAGKTDYLEAHYDLASCLMQIGKYDEAIWNLREAVRIDPNYAEAWLNLGSALYQAGHFADAASAYEQALQIRPGWDIAQKNLQAARSRM